MRIKNSLMNFSSGIFLNLISTILTFVSRTIFIQVLGKQYLGVNGLFTNILSMLSLAELGVGTAINFSLYQPIANNDNKKIKILMQFYKKAYRAIGCSVFIIGIFIMLFLNVFIKDSEGIQNLRLIFLIFLINTVSSYFITYKTTLLNAYQKGYKLTKVNAIASFLGTVAQLLVLIITNNYLAYLITNMLGLLITRIYVNVKVTKMYPILSEKETEKLPKEDLSKIITNIKAMMFHKIGDYCINGTDNIVISTFISLSTVGIYSNYGMIITMVNGIIVMFFNSMTASLGNMIVTESKEKSKEVFEVTNFIAFWVFGFASICFYNLLTPFIQLWIGKDYLIEQSVVLIVIINYFLTGMRVPVGTIKSAAGLYDQDKYTPLIQSAVNLCVSIVLAKKVGLIGVFIGTLTSSLVLPCWQRPMIVYKYIFKSSSKEYFKKYFGYIISVFGSGVLVTSFIKLFIGNVTIISFILMIIICLVVPNFIFLLIYRNSNEFKYILNIFMSMLGDRVMWIRKSV